MTQYISLNVKLSDLQLNTLKSRMTNGTKYEKNQLVLTDIIYFI